MHDETGMKQLIGKKKVETHPVVVSVISAHQPGGQSMRHSPTLSCPTGKDAIGIVGALNLKNSGIA